jgi:hypothetical protein
LQRFPVEPPSVHSQQVSQAPSQPQGRGKDWCSIHQTARRQTTKEGRS